MNKEHLALRNNFRVTKQFLITKFDCIREDLHTVDILVLPTYLPSCQRGLRKSPIRLTQKISSLEYKVKANFCPHLLAKKDKGKGKKSMPVKQKKSFPIS